MRTVALSRRDTPAGDARSDVIAPETVEKGRKVELLRSADSAAREQGGAITSVTASYADAHRRFVVANSDGLLADDDQVRTRMMVQCVATGDTGMQTGYEAPGRTMGFELFDSIRPEQIGRTAATRALSLLDAVPAPTGRIPVVLRKGAGGVLFHEACGHGLEADHIFKDASVFTGNMGELVASPLVTLVDDGTYGREWGTLAIDDEGHPAQRNVLIDHGVLTEYMWDLLRARKEGHASSGNGRRETYRHLPMPRMTNTFVLEGDTEPDAIVQGVEYGLYCVQLGGGQVNPATGDFVFGVTEAYLIEHGEITRPGARRAAHRERPRRAPRDRRGRERLRHVDGHVRQERPERAGLVGPADGAGARDDCRRDRRVTRPPRHRAAGRRGRPVRRAGRGVRRSLAGDGDRGVRRRGRVAHDCGDRRHRCSCDRRPPSGVRVGRVARIVGGRRRPARRA